MELQEAITARYSCRSFTERAIDSALLKTCVETAGLAPSACNSQPWKFHIIQDPAMVALTQPFTKHAAFRWISVLRVHICACRLLSLVWIHA